MKSLSNDNENENFDCETCGLTNIHKNDYENHLNSRKHKSNTKNAENCNKNETSYDCQYCHVKLTDFEFYKIHKNTKAHRKNVRKWQVNNKVSAEEIKSKVKGASNVDGVQNFKLFRMQVPNETLTDKADEAECIKTPAKQPSEFTRQKYKIRSSLLEENYYKSYTISLAAYLSLKLTLDPSIENFHISVNDKEFLSFGDLVVRITRNDKHNIYAIKCKQVSNSFKQINSLNEAKVIMEKEYINVEMFRKHPELSSVKFSIFTTANVTSSFCKTVPISAATLNKWKTCSQQFDDGATLLVRPFRKNVAVNVSTDPENVFSFALSQNGSTETIALPNIWFFSSQRLYSQMLDDLLKKFDNYPNIGKVYTKYIENWADAKLGGNYKLTKKDVVLKLGYLLLDKFTIAPKLINLPQSNFELWNQVTNKVDLIVVKNDPFIISKMCQPINRTIEEVFGIKIDTVSRTIDINGKITNITNPILKAYLFEEVDDLKEEIPLVKIYKVFWKWGKIPLLMSTENNEDAKSFVLDVISMMKQNGVNKKFLVKTSQPNSVKQRDDIRIFTNLHDIRDLVDLDQIHIKISDNFKISVKEIDATDPFFLKWAGPAVFFDMALEKYSFKVSNASKKGDAGDENQLKIILSEEMRRMIEMNLYETSGRIGNVHNAERLRGINPLALKL